ncbi:tetratricopeptide repeat protein [uncultured Microbulbifer sp.]|uniref:tetratricopeptide repeat protein n=1 Tax=uncultured Microbulbifer sp. TaxID=348147 RepID=UPI00260D18EA|nr:tetratricopeptide repeat protein [uncultured Microbulbifer sp.]
MEDLKSKIEKLASFLKVDKQNRRLLIDLVETCLRAGELEKAEYYLEQGLSHWAEDPSLLFQRGMLCLYKGEYSAAVDEFSSQIGTEAPQDVVIYNIAWAQLALQQPQNALNTLEGLETLSPRSALLKARGLHYLGRMQEAEELLSVAVASEETALEAESVLALVALDQEDSEVARVKAEAILAKAPRNVEANVIIGTLNLGEGNLQSAENHFEVALAEKPSSGRGWLGEGLLELLRGEFSHAISSLQKAVENMPTHLGSYNALAWAYICNGDLPGAEKIALQAKELEPRFSETLGTLAIIYLLKGKKSNAAVQAKMANRLSANSFAGRFALALLESDSGKQENAERMMTQILNSEINKHGELLVNSLSRYQNLTELKKED